MEAPVSISKLEFALRKTKKSTGHTKKTVERPSPPCFFGERPMARHPSNRVALGLIECRSVGDVAGAGGARLES